MGSVVRCAASAVNLQPQTHNNQQPTLLTGNLLSEILQSREDELGLGSNIGHGLLTNQPIN
jgi:hypothetical protein